MKLFNLSDDIFVLLKDKIIFINFHNFSCMSSCWISKGGGGEKISLFHSSLKGGDFETIISSFRSINNNTNVDKAIVYV